MSKELREAIWEKLRDLDELSEAEARGARKVLDDLLAVVAAEVLGNGDRATRLAEAIARGQQASIAASSGGSSANRHLTPEFITGVILKADIL